MPRGDEAASPIASPAGEYEDAGRCERAEAELGEVAARILHHLEQVDVKVVDHEAVDFAHLGLGYGRQLVNRKRLHCSPESRRRHPSFTEIRLSRGFPGRPEIVLTTDE